MMSNVSRRAAFGLIVTFGAAAFTGDTSTGAEPDDTHSPAPAEAATVTIKDVTITQVDESAGTVSVSFGKKDKPTKVENVPLQEGARVVASHVLPGSVNNLPFRWEYVRRLRGKVVSVRLRASAAGLSVVSIASGND